MAILTNSNDLVRAANASWQQLLKSAIRTPESLAQYLKIPLDSICPTQSNGDFPLFVPMPFLNRIRKGDPQDPLLRQVIPTGRESEPHRGFSIDPLNESQFEIEAGLLQKYRSRALLVVNGTCAIHCRYCFRRHFPYSASNDVGNRWSTALQQIRADPTIREIILSGGDPLTLVDEQLENLINRLDEIEHLERIRIHTRLPVVIPQRITRRLLSIFEASRLATVVVIHSNHANEIDDKVAESVKSLNELPVMILNQSVLLMGVNDNLPALMALSERLIKIGVTPYYLHQLDPVSGAAHFEVPVETGVNLIEQMRQHLSGYMVPRFVREIPGELNKTVLA